MKTILVTGAAGFVGSHLVDRLLAEECKVIAVDDFNDFYSPALKRENVRPHLACSGYTLAEGDIRDRQFLASVFADSKIDAVVHLAARAGVRPSLEQPVLYQEVNVAGTQNIFECCRNFKVKKCIFASSSSVYGINRKVPFAEDDPIFNPISPYAATKAAGELLAHVYSHLYDMQILCLRLFTVYGPRQRPDLAIHKFTRLMSEEKAIPVFGDGSTRRDYTYVGDIVAGIVAALAYDRSRYEVINLGNSDTVSLSRLIATLEAVLGKPALINRLPEQPGDVPQTFADIGKAGNLLGFRPHTPFEDGIKNFVEWYQNTIAAKRADR
jgi:Nucleoside-diphosphate-sugar epimerases